MNQTPTKPMKNAPRPRVFASMMYESLLLFGVVFVTAYLVTSFSQNTDPMRNLELLQTILFVVIGLYFVVCWVRIGQTLPMKTWHIGLVTKTGTQPSISQFILRYGAAWIIPLIGAWLVYQLALFRGWNSINILIIFTPFLNFVYSYIDPQGLFLHDRLANTRLIDLKAKLDK